MASLQTPQQQAGILSFYDAPEKGPKVNAKVILLIVIIFALIVIMLDHFVGSVTSSAVAQALH